MKSSRAFITGCDSNTEWMLEWFLNNYKKHNKTPIVLFDFGLSKEMRAKVYQLKMFADIVDLPRQKAGGWFYKPAALNKAIDLGYEEICWLDTDIEVLGDLSGVFDHIQDNKIGMVEDKPWSTRRGETWHNSGVIAMRNKPAMLKNWIEKCKSRPHIGDQEVLHELVCLNPLMREMHIATLPNIYNWLRIQLLDGHDSPDKLAMHWTGQKGKLEIKRKMYNE